MIPGDAEEVLLTEYEPNQGRQGGRHAHHEDDDDDEESAGGHRVDCASH